MSLYLEKNDTQNNKKIPRCSVNEAVTDPRSRFTVRGLPDGYPADLSKAQHNRNFLPSRKPIHIFFSLTGSYDQFTLENLWLPLNRPEETPMVLESNKVGHVFITMPDPENLNQKWVQLEDGVILNVGNRLPLSAETHNSDETGRTWNFRLLSSFPVERLMKW